jgi:hypothetical protein
MIRAANANRTNNVYGERYTATVSRKSANTYVDGNVTIITASCYEFVYYDNAIIYYENDGSLNNKITFSNGSNCQIRHIYKN